MGLKKIIFRGEANNKIGWGHISRLVSIANYCEGKYYRILVVNKYDKELGSLIKDNFDEIVELNFNETNLYTINEIELYVSLADIIVLDGYHFSSDYQRLVKLKNKKLIYIDDLISHDYYADVIINHAIGVDEFKYKKQSYSKLFLGPGYLMLREDFINHKPIFKLNDDRTILICFGGADPENFTQKVLNVCYGIKNCNIRIILGASNQSFNKKEIKNNVVVLNNLNTIDLIKEMTNASVFICSASTIAYEACTLGVPLLILKTSDNQQLIYRGLIENKCALGFDISANTNSIELVENILYNTILRQEIYNQQLLLFKGDVKNNYLGIFTQLDA